MNIIDNLMRSAFCESRPPRSKEYREGVRAALESKINGKKIVSVTYPQGTAGFDAFFAGVDEGARIAKEYKARQIEASRGE